MKTLFLYYTPVVAVIFSIFLPLRLTGYIALGAAFWYGALVVYGVMHRAREH